MTRKSALKASVAPVAPPVAPEAPATRIAKPGDNSRGALQAVTQAAATYGMRAILSDEAKDALIAQIKAYADHPTKDQLRALQKCVEHGYIAARVARAAGAVTVEPEHFAQAAVIIAKAGVGAAKAKPAGKRTADEERMCTSARGVWSGLLVRAEAAPDAGTGAGRAAGGIASAVARKNKRKARTIGATDVTVAAKRTAPAATAQPVAPRGKAASPMEAMVHVHAVAAELLAYVESNETMFAKVHAAKIVKACAALKAVPMPEA